MGAIVDIQLDRLRALLEDRKITLDVDEAALMWLGNMGYDPSYGARPLKRVIQKYLQNPLATMLLEGKIADGETVTVGVGDGNLVLNGEAVDAAEAA
jgi:ATP-dependent Clp protease ATP-binding subunit ClpB